MQEGSCQSAVGDGFDEGLARGTEIGDYFTHNLELDDGGAATLLSPTVAALFAIGRRRRPLLLLAYWTTWL